jgi:hypothetical protein
VSQTDWHEELPRYAAGTTGVPSSGRLTSYTAETGMRHTCTDATLMPKTGICTAAAKN